MKKENRPYVWYSLEMDELITLKFSPIKGHINDMHILDFGFLEIDMFYIGKL